MLRGYNFVDGQKVTAAQLNGVVDNGSILPAFYTSKSAKTNVSSTDLFLAYDVNANAYRKITGSALLLNNPSWISSMTENTTPANGDFFPSLNVASGTLMKVSLTNLWQFAGQPVATPLQMFTLLEWDSSSGSYYQLPIPTLKTNIGTNWSAFFVLTNLSAKASLVATDAFWVFDSVANTNKQVQFSTIQSNMFGLPGTNATQLIAGIETNGLPIKITNGFGIGLLTNTLYLSNYISTNMSVPTSRIVITNAHGLGSTPSIINAVLVCTNANIGYPVGSEIPVGAILNASFGALMHVSADSTNVYIGCFGEQAFSTFDKGTPASGLSAITKGSWNLRINARP